MGGMMGKRPETPTLILRLAQMKQINLCQKLGKVGREQPYIIINDTKPVQRWTMLPICRVSHAHGENVCRTLTNFRM